MKNPKIKDSKLEKLKTSLLFYIKNLKAIERFNKIKKKTNIIEIKGKNFEKTPLLLLKLIELIYLEVTKMLKYRIKIKY